MKKFLYGAGLVCATLFPAYMSGQDHLGDETTDLVKATAYARVDWQQNSIDGHTVGSNSGFEGKYLLLRFDGQILPGFTYSWRQRLNKQLIDGNFFDSTDWIDLKYEYSGIQVSMGKQEVMIGGWEYDRNPIDVFDYSVFTSNIACFQLAARGGYQFRSGDRLTFQVSQSPFAESSNRNLYALNLFWSGTHGCWSPLWSTNMVQYRPGHWINYIALGNRFDFHPVWLELDLMNRATRHAGFFEDNSIVAVLGYDIGNRWKVHGKFSLDRNTSDRDADYCVLPGTNLKMGGAGVEFFPLKTDRHHVRVHADCYYSWGTNSNSADIMQDKTLLWGLGVTWQMNLFSLK